MSQNQAAGEGCTLSTAPVFDLDPATVGEILIRLGAGAVMLGHTRAVSSIRDYAKGARSAELKFVRDVLTQPTGKYAERWYNGEMEAMHFAQLGVRHGTGAWR